MINKVAVMSYSAKFASSFYGPFRLVHTCKAAPVKILLKFTKFLLLSCYKFAEGFSAIYIYIYITVDLTINVA